MAQVSPCSLTCYIYKNFTDIFPDLCNYRLACFFFTYCLHLQFINVNRYIKIYIFFYICRKFHKGTGFAQNVDHQKRFVLLKGQDVCFLKNQMKMKFRRKRLKMHKSKFVSIISRNLLCCILRNVVLILFLQYPENTVKFFQHIVTYSWACCCSECYSLFSTQFPILPFKPIGKDKLLPVHTMNMYGE